MELVCIAGAGAGKGWDKAVGREHRKLREVLMVVRNCWFTACFRFRWHKMYDYSVHVDVRHFNFRVILEPTRHSSDG